MPSQAQVCAALGGVVELTAGDTAAIFGGATD